MIIVLLTLMMYVLTLNHDVNSCPYYDVSDELYARLNAMIETINERYEHFVSEMSECGLLHETDPSLPFLGLSLVSLMLVSLPFP